MFNVGDLVKLNYSKHIGIVIEKSDWAGAVARPGAFEDPKAIGLAQSQDLALSKTQIILIALNGQLVNRLLGKNLNV